MHRHAPISVSLTPLFASLLLLCLLLGLVAPAAAQTSQLTYSTYLEGNDETHIFAITMDSTGAVIATGFTVSQDFPTTAGAFQPVFDPRVGDSPYTTNSFVTKMSADGHLLASTYLGTTEVAAKAVAVDAAGNIYVGGMQNCQYSVPLPVSAGAAQPTCAGNADAFLAKFDPSLTHLLYLTYLGGTQNDEIDSVAVDAAGNAYVAGFTASPDLPTTAGALQRTYGGRLDAFVAKIDPQGQHWIYTTYLGGSSLEDVPSIAIDPEGNAYVTGGTSSADFPVSASAFQTKSLKLCQEETCGGYVVKIDPTGSQLLWSTYLSFPGDSYFFSIAVDTAGQPVIAGKVGTGLPGTPGPFSKQHGNGDAFIAKLKADGTGLVFLDYFGGSRWDGAQGVALDEANNIWIAGRSSSPDLPLTQGAWNQACSPQPGYAECEQSFIAKFSADGNTLLYSSYVNASNPLGTGAWAVAAAPGQGAAMAGYAYQGLSSSPGAFQPEYFGANEKAFIARFSSLPTPSVPSIAVTPSQLIFPATAAGAVSAAQTVTVTNNGAVALQIASSNATADFGVQSGCTQALNPGDSCLLTVSYQPSGSITSGTLTVTPSDGSAAVVGLTGSVAATPPAGSPAPPANPATFAIASPATAVIANTDGSAQVPLQLNPSNGFTGTVKFSCQGLPTGASCAFSPTTLNVTQSDLPAQVVLTVQLPKLTALLPAALLMGSLGLLLPGIRRRKLMMLSIGLLFLAVGCGAGPMQGPTQTPSGAKAPTTYTVTVVASSGSVQQTTTVTLKTP